MSFCEIILVGNCGRRTEMRQVSTGTNVCDFTMAVNRNRMVNGDWQTDTTWFRVTAWGRLAEVVDRSIEKGKLVLVVADRIEASAYVSKDGEARASLEVTAKTIRILSSKNSGGYDDDYGNDDYDDNRGGGGSNYTRSERNNYNSGDSNRGDSNRGGSRNDYNRDSDRRSSVNEDDIPF